MLERKEATYPAPTPALFPGHTWNHQCSHTDPTCCSRVEFSLLCPSKIPFHPFSVCELHTTPQPHLKAAKNWFESLFKLRLHTKSPWELHSQMLNQAEGLGSICAHKHNSRDFTKGINPEVCASLIFPLGPGRSSGLGLNTVGDGDNTDKRSTERPNHPR